MINIVFKIMRENPRVVGIDKNSKKIYVKDFESWEELSKFILKWKGKDCIEKYMFYDIDTEFIEEKERLKEFLKGIREISWQDLPQLGSVVEYNGKSYIVGSGISMLTGYLMKSSKLGGEKILYEIF